MLDLTNVMIFFSVENADDHSGFKGGLWGNSENQFLKSGTVILPVIL